MSLKSRIRERAARGYRAVKRAFGATPLCRVIAEVERRGFSIADADALEAFARAGDWYALDYASRVKSLEAWEIDSVYEADLRRNLPRAKVKITDTYRELATTANRYDFVVCDAPLQPFGDKVENFELFPHLCRVLKDSAVVVLNVIPSVGEEWKATYPQVFSPEHLRRRKEFYGVDHPENVDFDCFQKTYTKLFQASGFTVQWCFAERRNFFYYMAFKVVRTNSARAAA